jgi:DNA-3-methyladenine glycosylase I
MELILPDGKTRCFGNKAGQELLAHYHDTEWGVPVRNNDRLLFEMLTMEGAQAGLNWEIILKRRDGYKAAFHDFDIAAVAAMSDAKLEALRSFDGIIKNRLKIYSTRSNAVAFAKIQSEFGSFSEYLWGFVDGGVQIVNHYRKGEMMPASTPLSDAISKDLKKRGFRFVGTTIIYAYIQGVGLVNDHLADCWCASQTSS